MENIELPLDLVDGIIVQLYIDGQPWLKVGKARTDQGINRYHGELLEEILTQHGIPFDMVDTRNKMFPKLCGERYEAVGMGSCQKVGNNYSFGGWSLDYSGSIEINEKHLQEMQSLNPELRFIW